MKGLRVAPNVIGKGTRHTFEIKTLEGIARNYAGNPSTYHWPRLPTCLENAALRFYAISPSLPFFLSLFLSVFLSLFLSLYTYTHVSTNKRIRARSSDCRPHPKSKTRGLLLFRHSRKLSWTKNTKSVIVLWFVRDDWSRLLSTL